MNKVTIMVGDVIDRLGEIPDGSVHCCVTSPPYWGLRDYGAAGQLGLEPTIEEYIEKMTAVFEEVRRVLRDDGTLWLNMGDCYSAAGWECKRRNVVGEGACPKELRGRSSYRRDKRPREDDPHKSSPGLKNKDLVGQPWRLAFALQAAGWYLRSDIIWHKPNPMPESCRDRPTKSHEYIFLLTKKPRYFFDQDAVKEAVKEASVKRCRAGFTGNDPERDKHNNYGEGFMRGKGYEIRGRNIRSVWKIASQAFPGAHFATFPEELPRRCIAAGTSENGCCPECGAPWARVLEKGGGTPDPARGWDTAPGAHCREKRRTLGSKGDATSADVRSSAGAKMGRGAGWRGDPASTPQTQTIGWQPGCRCYHTVGLPEYPDDPSPAEVDYIREERRALLAIWSRLPVVCATVHDPFGGSGTTGLVATKMGRDAVLIELSPKYAEMAWRRIRNECGILATVTVVEKAPEKTPAIV